MSLLLNCDTPELAVEFGALLAVPVVEPVEVALVSLVDAGGALDEVAVSELAVVPDVVDVVLLGAVLVFALTGAEVLGDVLDEVDGVVVLVPDVPPVVDVDAELLSFTRVAEAFWSDVRA